MASSRFDELTARKNRQPVAANFNAAIPQYNGPMPTIKDIARECGVSANTVSCVLNNKQGEVGEQTKVRILDAIRRLGYRPNAAARQMAGRRTNTIGIADHYAVGPVSDPYKVQILEPLVYAARAAQKDVLYYSGHVDNVGYPAFLDGRADGLVCFTGGIDQTEITAFFQNAIPVVFIGEPNQDLSGYEATVIDVDNELGGFIAASHLIELGHRRVAIIEVPGVSGNQHRVDGYRRAHVESGITPDESLNWSVPEIGKFGLDAAIELLEANRSLGATAIFCFNDKLAFTVLEAAASLGIPVPGDLSVIGFDDVDHAAHTEPPLTTVRQPLAWIGQRAVQILIEILEDQLSRNHKEVVKPDLIIRQSTAPPK